MNIDRRINDFVSKLLSLSSSNLARCPKDNKRNLFQGFQLYKNRFLKEIDQTPHNTYIIRLVIMESNNWG